MLASVAKRRYRGYESLGEERLEMERAAKLSGHYNTQEKLFLREEAWIDTRRFVPQGITM